VVAVVVTRPDIDEADHHRLLCRRLAGKTEYSGAGGAPQQSATSQPQLVDHVRPLSSATGGQGPGSKRCASNFRRQMPVIRAFSPLGAASLYAIWRDCMLFGRWHPFCMQSTAMQSDNPTLSPALAPTLAEK